MVLRYIIIDSPCKMKNVVRHALLQYTLPGLQQLEFGIHVGGKLMKIDFISWGAGINRGLDFKLNTLFNTDNYAGAL